MKDTKLKFSTQTKDLERQSDFAFAVDTLDDLYLKLQGKGIFAHELFALSCGLLAYI